MIFYLNKKMKEWIIQWVYLFIILDLKKNTRMLHITQFILEKLYEKHLDNIFEKKILSDDIKLLFTSTICNRS